MKHRRQEAWKFLNSGFGLFLCSSVFLSLLSFSYQQWSRAVERQKVAEQIDVEIALRIHEVTAMAAGERKSYYSNVVNIERVLDGKTDRFYLRKPLFAEFENKNATTLLWQLYLNVSSSEKPTVRAAITSVRKIESLIEHIRATAPGEVPDRPKPSTKQAEDAQDIEDDTLKKDFGQAEMFRLINELNGVSRWKSIE
jgi:hypothetical protein